MRKSVLIFFCSLCVSSNVYAENRSENEIASDMLRMYSSESYLNEQMKQYGLNGEKREIVKSYTKWAVTHPEFIKRASKIIKQIGDNGLNGSNQEAWATGRKIGMALLNEFSSKGLSKLSVSDLRTTYSIALKTLNGSPSSYCKKFFFGPQDTKFINESATATKNLYSKLKVFELREVIALSKRTLEASFDDTQTARIIQPYERDIANKALQNLWVQECKKLPTEECKSLVRTTVNPNTATDEDLCNAGKFMLKTMYKLDDTLFPVLAIDSLQH